MNKHTIKVARENVKEYLESLMRTERDVFIDKQGVLRNWFYEHMNKEVRRRLKVIDSLHTE